MVRKSLFTVFLLLLSICLPPRGYSQTKDPISSLSPIDLTKLTQAKGQIVTVHLNNGDVRKGQLIEATSRYISLKVKRGPLYSEDEQISLSEIQKITDANGNEITSDKGEQSGPATRPGHNKEQASKNPQSVKSPESKDQDLQHLLDLLGPSEKKSKEAEAQPLPEKKEPEPKPTINPNSRTKDTVWAQVSQQEERQDQNPEGKILPTEKNDLDLLRISGLLGTPANRNLQNIDKGKSAEAIQKIVANKSGSKPAGSLYEKKKASPTSATNPNQKITELPPKAENQNATSYLSETLREMRSSIKHLNDLINRLTNLTIISIMGLACLIGFTLWRQKGTLNLIGKQRDSQLPIRVIKLQGTQAIADEGSKGGLQAGETLTVMRRMNSGFSDIGLAQVVKVTDHTSRIKFVEKSKTTSFQVGDVLCHNGHRSRGSWKHKLVQLSRVIGHQLTQRLNFIPVKKSKGNKKKRSKPTLS